MHAQLHPVSTRVERPRYVWLAVAVELVTVAGALPVGIQMIGDPTGSSLGMEQSWISGSVFPDYLVPGLFLFGMNGVAMLVLAGLTVARHWTAPWLTGALGVGLIIWIGVQVLAIPTMQSFLQLAFVLAGFALGFVSLFWLRRTGQLRAW